jgi:hypothetical protein
MREEPSTALPNEIFENIGTEKPMMMTMIAMTTSNSTNVNPDTLRIL